MSVWGENLCYNFIGHNKYVNVKLCMMVGLNELYPCIPISVITIKGCISVSQQCQTVLTENFMFLSDEVETLCDY